MKPCLRDLFELALQTDPENLDRVLAEACGSDAARQAEVRRLIESDGEAEHAAFWNSSALQVEAANLIEPAPIPFPQRIGRYRLLDVIGDGGMGRVYRAVRDDAEFEKNVALKVIKRGMDTSQIIQRFRTERQILANLEHPSIAHLLDGGTTEDGLPYLVMEYVDGLPIDQYARQHNLSIPERLQLFCTVCSAVQYAHQNLVIHRDLKPGNILVTPEGTPKLLDFGIAKLLEPVETMAAHTRPLTAMAFMTPEYSSPEQVRGEPMATTSDVYSLGILLYELLTGSRPYNVKSRTLEAAAAAICSQQVQKPSTVSAALRGDLDNIVLMAVRKEPARRYSSAGLLAEDIQRYLNGHPVLAHADSFRYRAGKFLRRHSLAVAAGSVVGLTLIAGMSAIAWEAKVARAETARAERRFNDVRKLANSLIFEVHDSIQDIPGTLAARQLLLKNALEYLDSLAREAGDDRALQAELAAAYHKVGRSTFNVPVALAAHEKALTLVEALVRSDPQNERYRNQLVDSLGQVATLRRDAGDSEGALNKARQAVATMESLASTHPANPDYRLGLANSYDELSQMLSQVGRRKESVQAEEKAMALSQDLLRSDPKNKEYQRAVMLSLLFKARALSDSGSWSAALNNSRSALKIAEALSTQDSSNVIYRRDLWVGHLYVAGALAKVDDPRLALTEYRKALKYITALTEADAGDKGHQRGLAVTHLAIANLLAGMGSQREALAEYRKAVSLSQSLLRADPHKIETRIDLANMYTRMSDSLRKTGHRAEGEQGLEKARVYFEEAARFDPANANVEKGRAELFARLANSSASHAFATVGEPDSNAVKRFASRSTNPTAAIARNTPASK